MKREINHKEAMARVVAGLPTIVVETQHPQTREVEFRYFVEVATEQASDR